MDSSLTDNPRRRLRGDILIVAIAISFATTGEEENREGKLST